MFSRTWPPSLSLLSILASHSWAGCFMVANWPATAPGLTCPHNHIPSRRRADLLLISSLLGTKTLPGLSSRVPLPFIVKTGNQQMFSIKGQIVNNLGVMGHVWSLQHNHFVYVAFFFFTTFQNVNTILSSWSRTICMPTCIPISNKGRAHLL